METCQSRMSLFEFLRWKVHVGWKSMRSEACGRISADLKGMLMGSADGDVWSEF